MKFLCSGCGLCCKGVGAAIEAAKKGDPNDPANQEFLNFPYGTKEDGSCEMQAKDGSCKVYDNRPDICDVERTYHKIEEPKGKETKKEFFIRNNNHCNTFISQNGYPDKFLIDTKEYG